MTPLLNRAERRALGQARRRALPRSGHAEWTPPPGRPDPVSAVLASEAGRIPALLPLRHARMAPDAFTFLRGAAALMAADLGSRPSSGLRVVACGDAHMNNFGAFAAPEGTPIFDVNDFDEATEAPFEWDVKRLATSLVVAGRVRGLPAKAARALARRAAHAYRRHIDTLASAPLLDAWRSRIDVARIVEDIPDREVRRRERQRIVETARESHDTFAHLVSRSGALHLPERPPAIWRLGADEPIAHAAFDAYLAELPPERRALLDRYRLRDVAFKAVGVGSVGTFCAIGLFATTDSDVLLLQMKEAKASVLEAVAGVSPYTPGQRVVTAQRTMQAAPDLLLGWTPHPIDGRYFYVRRLADPRLASFGAAIEGDALRFYAVLCARTLARAHARSGDAAMIAGYLGESDAFDEAIERFATAYADQTESDHAAWVAAIAERRVEVSP